MSARRADTSSPAAMEAIRGRSFSIGCRRSTRWRLRSSKSEVGSLKSENCASYFRLQTSDFRLQTSDFRLQTSSFTGRQHGFGRLFHRLQKRADLLAQLVLNAIDRTARVEHAEMEFVGHRLIFFEQLVLIGSEAVVDVVAVLQVHPRFPIV